MLPLLDWLKSAVARGRRRELSVWYDPDYRLPLSGLESGAGIEPRRADHAAWYLVQTGALSAAELRTPQPASYEDLSRVHSAEYLDSLQSPEALAHIFAVDPSEI